MCDDIDTTVGELRAKGAQFRAPIEQREYGRVIMMIVPGADDIQNVARAGALQIEEVDAGASEEGGDDVAHADNSLRAGHARPQARFLKIHGFVWLG